MGISHRGCRMTHPPPIFSLSTYLPNTNSARQRDIADKTQGSPICRQFGLELSLFVGNLRLCISPAIIFSFVPDHLRPRLHCFRALVDTFHKQYRSAFCLHCSQQSVAKLIRFAVSLLILLVKDGKVIRTIYNLSCEAPFVLLRITFWFVAIEVVAIEVVRSKSDP